MMRPSQRIFLTSAAATAMLLSGCAYYGYPYHPSQAALVYYDGFYGPFYDGYWAPDGFFYFREVVGRPYRRDESHHFRPDGAGGFNRVTIAPGPMRHVEHAPPARMRRG